MAVCGKLWWISIEPRVLFPYSSHPCKLISPFATQAGLQGLFPQEFSLTNSHLLYKILDFKSHLKHAVSLLCPAQVPAT